MTTQHKPHSEQDFKTRQAHAIATDLATHHRLCDSHKGGECDCYANAGSHALAFAYLELKEEAEKWHREALDWQQAKSECDSEYEELDRAYRQACMNLATIRPDLTRDDFSLGEQADLYYDALLAGWGGIEGYDRGRNDSA